MSLRDKTDTWRTFTVTGRLGRVTLYRGAGRGDVVGYADGAMYDLLTGRGGG